MYIAEKSPESTIEVELEIFRSISQIDREDWQRLVSGQFPFETYQHFSILENSKVIGAGTGWHPFYLMARYEGAYVGALYLYLKEHSYGEYIFDWQWAGLAERLNIPYYPKLMSAMPFTPATGAKLLIRRTTDRKKVVSALMDGAKNLMSSLGGQSLHFLFIGEDERQDFAANEMKVRNTFQFHWKNYDYSSFSDFTERLKQKKSKEIRREREKIKSSGLKFEVISGEDLTENLADQMYNFYLTTIDKKQSFAYLNREYFRMVFAEMPQLVRLFVCRKDERVVASSLCYHQGDKLFGRYWGAEEGFKNLHFELCYYQPIEYAIKNRIQIFEAGAQGPHKIQRGFMPEKTYSAHFCTVSPLAEYIHEIIDHENDSLEQGLLEFASSSPYRSRSPVE